MTGARYCSNHCHVHHRNLKTAERYLPLPPPPPPPPPSPRTHPRARASKNVLQAAQATTTPLSAAYHSIDEQMADGAKEEGALADDSVEVFKFEADGTETAADESSQALREELLTRFPELEDGGRASALAQEACESEDDMQPLGSRSAPASRLKVSKACGYKLGKGGGQRARVSELKRELAEHGIKDTSTQALLEHCLSLVKQQHS
jgi:hypothetical protein